MTGATSNGHALAAREAEARAMLEEPVGPVEQPWPRTRRPVAPGRRKASAAASANREDQARVGALVRGDRGAWDSFVHEYAGVIYAAVLRRLQPAGRAHDVEDVAQDVFVRLCKSDHKLLRGYDPARARLSTWLTVIATSAAIDHLRRQRGAQMVAVDDVPDSRLAVEDPPFERIQIPDGLLSERQALVLELLYRRDLEVADAARIMNVDPQTVRSTHHKALTKLRAHFQNEAG